MKTTDLPCFRLSTLMLTVSILGGGLPRAAQAQEDAVTDPVGYIGYEVPGAKLGQEAGFPVSFALTGGVNFASRMASVQGASFTSQSPILGSVDPVQEYIHVVDGPRAGVALEIQSVVGNTVTVKDFPAGALAAGYRFSIRQRLQLDTQLPNGINGWQRATKAEGGDNLVFWDSAGQTARSLFVDLAGVWRDSVTLQEAGQTWLPFPAAMLILRRGTLPLSFVNVGHVPVPTTHWLQVRPGLNMLGRPLSFTSLADSGLYEADSAFSLTGGATATEADTLTYYDEGIRHSSIWFQTGPGGGWRDLQTGEPAGQSTFSMYGALLVQHQGPETWVKIQGVSIAPAKAKFAYPLADAFRIRPRTPVIALPVPVTISRPRTGPQGQLQLAWPTVKNKQYELQVSVHGVWSPGRAFIGTGRKMTVNRPISKKQELFRVVRK